MSALLLDTHAWVWSFAEPALLSDDARRAIAAAETVYVSPISFFEIGQKVRTVRWPGMEGLVSDLPALLEAQSGLIAPFTAAICLSASTMDWAHRDPFDRLILATAVAMDIPLITKDRVFADRPGVRVVW